MIKCMTLHAIVNNVDREDESSDESSEFADFV